MDSISNGKYLNGTYTCLCHVIGLLWLKAFSLGLMSSFKRTFLRRQSADASSLPVSALAKRGKFLLMRSKKHPIIGSATFQINKLASSVYHSSRSFGRPVAQVFFSQDQKFVNRKIVVGRAFSDYRIRHASRVQVRTHFMCLLMASDL